jgi:hypothetical protein
VGHELGRAADLRRDDGPLARKRLEHRLPERLDEAGLTEDVARSDPVGDAVVRNASGQEHPLATGEPLPVRPVSYEGQRPGSEAGEGVGEPNDVLALVQGAHAEKAGPLAVPAKLRPKGFRLPVVEAVEIDSAVDHGGLPSRLGELRLELAAKVVGDCDNGIRAADDPSRSRTHAANRADVPDVATMCRDDEPRAAEPRGKGGCCARREEEMGVDHIRPEASSCRDGPSRQGRVFQRSAASVIDHHALELIPLALELVGDLLDEDTEIRRRRAGKKLRDQENSHFW